MPACLRGGACHRSRARGAACLPISWPSPSPILSYVCAHRPIAGMPRPVGTDRRPKGPPCKVPMCPDPENASGQWAYLLADFWLKHPELDKDDCHCHKRGCRRDVGKEPPRQQPGRKRLRADSPVVSAGLKAADELPRSLGPAPKRCNKKMCFLVNSKCGPAQRQRLTFRPPQAKYF